MLFEQENTRRKARKYQIQGKPIPVGICELETGEKMITKGDAMAWMTPNMKMETSADDADVGFHQHDLDIYSQQIKTLKNKGEE